MVCQTELTKEVSWLVFSARDERPDAALLWCRVVFLARHFTIDITMIFETSRRRSVSLCHSWQFKICLYGAGSCVDIDEFDSLNGSHKYIAHDKSSSSLDIVSRLPIALFESLRAPLSPGRL